MPLTDIATTEKVMGRVTNVQIGYDADHGVNLKKGILSFEYDRIHDNLRQPIPGAATRNVVQQLGMNFFTWKLKFLSDCRQAFFATDVQVADGNQYAMVDNNLSNKIEYFKVKVAIEDSSSVPKIRTYTITNGYALRNRAYIGDDETAIYEYEGDCEYLSYEDGAT